MLFYFVTVLGCSQIQSDKVIYKVSSISLEDRFEKLNTDISEEVKKALLPIFKSAYKALPYVELELIFRQRKLFLNRINTYIMTTYWILKVFQKVKRLHLKNITMRQN